MQPVPSPTAPDGGVTVHFDRAVLELIRSAADSGLKSLPRRGAEIGGLLITSSAGEPIRSIDEAALIPSEYRYGPGYHLSPRDLGLLRSMAAGARGGKDRRIAGLFRSCTAEQFELSPNDLDVLREELPEARVLLLVKPFADGHAVARVYQSCEGKWERTAEFSIPVERPAARPLSVAHKIRTAAKPLVTMPAAQSAAKKARALPVLWIYSVLGCLLLVSAIALLGPRPAENVSLGLNVVPEGDVLRITWNRNSPAVRSGTGGTLRIDEGTQRRDLTLTPAQLSSGSVMYRSGAVDVTFHLTVNGGTHAQETIRFVTGAAPPAAAPPVTTEAPKAATSAPLPPLAGERPELRPIRKSEAPVEPAAAQPAPKRQDSPAMRFTPEQNLPSKSEPAPPAVQQPEVPAQPAAAPVQPPATGQVVDEKPAPPPWEPMKSVMHYFDDSAVTHPTPVREARPKQPKSGMPSQPVQIRVLVAVDTHGDVAGAQPVDPPANAGEDLIDEALAAARRWKFEPARDHGKKVRATYTITFRFPPENP